MGRKRKRIPGVAYAENAKSAARVQRRKAGQEEAQLKEEEKKGRREENQMENAVTPF